MSYMVQKKMNTCLSADRELQNDEECDATEVDSSTKAGNKKTKP
jgi:hypothetical protein